LNRNRWIALAAVVLVAVTGFWLVKGRNRPEKTRYRTAAVERGAIESVVSATGTIRPVIQVEVGSQVSGTISAVHADYNSRVRRGQVLCQLDPSSFRARAVQAQAAVAKSDAAVKDARRVLERARELKAGSYISQAEVDAAEVALDQRNAEQRQARAQLEVSEVDLKNTTIRAPIDGIVIARSVDLGQTVAASLQAPKLFVIANNLSEMQVETRIDEADIGRIHPGLGVRFTVDAFPDREFEGRVAQVRLEPIVEQGVVTYTTVIRTKNPELRLRPGMTANVSVSVATRESVLKVPSAALRFRPPDTGPGGPGGMRGGPGGGGGGARAGIPGMGAPTAMAGAREGAAARGGAGPRAGGPGGPGMRGGAGGPGMRGGPGGPGMRGGPGGGGGRAGAEGAVAGTPPDVDRAMTLTAADAVGVMKPGRVYVLRAGKPVQVSVMTGLTDGVTVEVRADSLLDGDQVIVGTEGGPRAAQMTPPPGMGGPMFGGRGGGGRR
jgi:HlyD family secretion protein